jgi:type II secretory pathway pseudopilin PulG
MKIPFCKRSDTSSIFIGAQFCNRASDFGFRPSFGPRISVFGFRRGRAFTLIEVMIATGIFFMATFAILALVSTTLRNARALQRGDVDAGMAAAQIYQTMKTNRLVETSGSGNFGEAYPDYGYEYVSQQYQSNGLLQVDIIVTRRGLRKPVDAMTIWVYNPDARSGMGGPMIR